MPDIEPQRGGLFVLYIDDLPNSIAIGQNREAIETGYRSASLGQKAQKISVRSIYDCPIDDVIRVGVIGIGVIITILAAGPQRGPRGLA